MSNKELAAFARVADTRHGGALPSQLVTEPPLSAPDGR